MPDQRQTTNETEERKLRELFARANALPLSAPPFLASRVVAQLAGRRRERRRLLFWRALSGGLAAACLVLLVGFWKRPGAAEALEARVGRPQVVRVALEEPGALEAVAEAEIVLPEGVRFYSESFPDIAAKRELRISWNSAFAGKALPFVIRGDQAGLRLVTVRFLDSAGKAVAERRIAIRFEKVES